MAYCEMCGASTNKLSKTKVAGSLMNLCDNCSKLGSKIDNPNLNRTFYIKKKIEEDNFDLVDNYSSKINSALSKRGITIHHLARALNIKESTLHKVLNNKFDLEIDLARRIEKFLEIKLVIEVSEKDNSVNIEELTNIESEKNNLNLADLIKQQLKNKGDSN